MNEAEFNETVIETQKLKKNSNLANSQVDSFDALNPFMNITFGFKVVPPISNEYNSVAYLMQKMSLISDTEDGPEHQLYDKDAVGDIDSDVASPKFFKWDRWSMGDNSFQFATLKFDEEHVPTESPRYCLGLLEANLADKHNYDLYNEVFG